MSYTTTTRHIADHLVQKVINEHGGLHRVPAYELTYMIERELDKYFDGGTLQWGEKREQG